MSYQIRTLIPVSGCLFFIVEVWLLHECRLMTARVRLTAVFAGIAVLKKKAIACLLILHNKQIK
jgi:hypothetical protein